MSTTAHTTSATSSAQHAAPAQQNPRAAQAKPPADLFAQLLALAEGAPEPELASELAPEAEPDPKDDKDPLKDLMAWVAPAPQDGALAAAPGSAGLVAETRSLDGRAERQAGLGEAAPAGARRPGALWQAASGAATALTKTNPGAAAGTGLGASTPASAGSDLPALHWSRVSAPEAGINAGAWPVRSTVALDTRLQHGNAAAGLSAAWAAAEVQDESQLPGALAPAGGRQGGDAATALVSAAGASGDAGLGGDSSAADGGGSFGQPSNEQQGAQDPYAAPADAEAVEVQHWGSGALRHASLRVGDSGADADKAIDIALNVRGDEVQLNIRTDDAATRELLREQAQASLGERLQQGGLSLGSVSVGEQGQGQASSERREAGPARADALAADKPQAAAPTAAPAAQSGARGALDVFI